MSSFGLTTRQLYDFERDHAAEHAQREADERFVSALAGIQEARSASAKAASLKEATDAALARAHADLTRGHHRPGAGVRTDATNRGVLR